MALLDLVYYGDPILRKVCKPVEDFSNVPTIVDDMFDTMYEAEGVGLAANQIGLNMNLFLVDVTHTDEVDQPYIFINGKIIDSWGESFYSEGCLSIPELHVEVKRPEFIKFQYQTPDESVHLHEFSGMTARVIQHEMDHLTGFLIIDRISPLARMQHKKLLRDIAENAQHPSVRHSSKKDMVL